jgi:hypothetical protein
MGARGTDKGTPPEPRWRHPSPYGSISRKAETDANAVRLRGNAMTRRTTAIFRNDQWEVTASGIVSRLRRAPCRWQIDAELLLATDVFDDKVLYDWPPYVVRKPWVEPELFFEAFRAAIAVHNERYVGEVDPDTLDASFETARRIAADRNDPRTANG